MRKYIDVKDVREVLDKLRSEAEDTKKLPDNYADGWLDALTDAANKIDDIPTVDFCSEKHGTWVHLGGDEWSCSRCGFVISTESSREHPMSEGLCNDYCCHCGAKMSRKDGDSND